MRTCKVFKLDWTGVIGNQMPKRILESEAVFHGFSEDHEELSDGVGRYPVAIVEFPDGSLASRHVEFVRFNEPTQAQACPGA